MKLMTILTEIEHGNKLSPRQKSKIDSMMKKLSAVYYDIEQFRGSEQKDNELYISDELTTASDSIARAIGSLKLTKRYEN